LKRSNENSNLDSRSFLDKVFSNFFLVSGYRRFEVRKRKLTIQGIENHRQQLKTEYYEKEISAPVGVNTNFRYIGAIP
jgi:hypothetical protein